MKLKLVRDVFAQGYTQGMLYVDDVFECYTLEDEVRAAGVKVDGETAIPEGHYRVIVNQSARFSKKAGCPVFLPQIIDVPNFDGVRIHAGNRPHDTEGCVLVGQQRVPGAVQQSRFAMMALMEQIEAALHLGQDVTIDIVTSPRATIVP